MHGEDDQIVSRLIKGAEEIYYPGAPHGLTATHPDQVSADLLGFLKRSRKSAKAAKAA